MSFGDDVDFMDDRNEFLQQLIGCDELDKIEEGIVKRTRTSSFPRVSRWRLCHSKEPSARDRKMRDFCQGFRALGSMDRDLVWLYCVIEDVVRQILGETRLRSRGPTPELTDVESLTFEIFGETLGLNSDRNVSMIMRQAVIQFRLGGSVLF